MHDQDSIREAQYNLDEARAESERAAMENLSRMNAMGVRPHFLRNVSNRSISNWSEGQGYSRRAIVILNQLLSSIGRPEVDL